MNLTVSATLLFVLIVYGASEWQISKKMGLHGWERFIPLWKLRTVFSRVTGKDPKMLLILLCIFIPFIGSLIVLVFALWYAVQFVHAFGVRGFFRTIAFMTIWYPALGLGDFKFHDGMYEIDDHDFVDALLGKKAKAANNYVPEIKAPVLDPEVRICPNCGTELKPGMNFCRKCGTRVL